jgi:formylglycine-generating enzyme required for sulfatase activity
MPSQMELAARSATESEFWTGEGTSLGGDHSSNTCAGDVSIDNAAGAPPIAAYAWYCGNDGWEDEGDSGTKEVAQLLPNGSGLYDLHGNISEWSNDWYDGTYPSSAEDPEGPSSGSYRILRGGCWDGGPDYLRSSSRDYTFASTRDDIHGFRLLRTAP